MFEINLVILKKYIVQLQLSVWPVQIDCAAMAKHMKPNDSKPSSITNRACP